MRFATSSFDETVNDGFPSSFPVGPFWHQMIPTMYPQPRNSIRHENQLEHIRT